MPRKVLVTGGAGGIATAFKKYSEGCFEISSLDRVEVDGIPSHVADMAVLGDILPAFKDIDTVVHLGADPNPQSPWDSVLNNNIVATHNVFEAAQQSGVKRVIFASSNHTVGSHYKNTEPFRSILDGNLNPVSAEIPVISKDVIRPCCLYGVSKVFGEAIASYYHDIHGLSCICIRIGGISRENRSDQSTSNLVLWLSHRDASQLISKCIEAPGTVGFEIVYGTSNNDLRFGELDTAKSVLGYSPQDNAGSNVHDQLPRTHLH